MSLTKRTWLTVIVLLTVGLTWVFAWQRKAQAQGAISQSQSAISEVSVFHSIWFGPNYKVTLKRDGTATFIGYSDGDKLGTYTAHFVGFDHLARAIEQRGYWHFKDNSRVHYTVPVPTNDARHTATTVVEVSDAPQTITTVVEAGRNKAVDKFGECGPQELWEVETLIGGVVAEAHWHKISSETDNL